MIKPFNPLELTARVKSRLRRYMELNPNVKEANDSILRIKDIVIDVARHKVLVDDREVALTPIEFDIQSCWPVIRIGYFLQMKFLKRSGMKKCMRPIIR